VPDGNDPDRLTILVQLIDHDVAPDHEPPQARIDLVREAPPQKGVFGEGLDTVKKVLNDASCSSRVFLGNEVEKLRGPLQGGIGPEDAVGHLLVTSQETSAGLVMRDDSSRLDVG
jgi:hypothetical protein